MQQMTKRWLSLLLAAVLCVTAGGVPALAAELAEGNTAAADSQTGGEESSEPETGGGEAEDNDITTLPTLGEDRPVISDDAPTEGGDTGDTGVLTPFGKGEKISAGTPIAMEFHYEIPAGASLTKDFTYEFEVEAPLAFKVDVDITGEDGKTVVARGTTSKGTNGKTGFTLTSRCRKRANSMQKTTRLNGR